MLWETSCIMKFLWPNIQIEASSLGKELLAHW